MLVKEQFAFGRQPRFRHSSSGSHDRRGDSILSRMRVTDKAGASPWARVLDRTRPLAKLSAAG